MRRQETALLIAVSITFAGLIMFVMRPQVPTVASITQQAFAAANVFAYDDAIAAVSEAISQAPTRGYSNRQLAQLYALRGQMIILTYEWDRALADYNTAVTLDPTYPDAYFHRGLLYYTNYVQIEFERARADFATYLSLTPDGQYAALAVRYIGDIDDQIEALGSP